MAAGSDPPPPMRPRRLRRLTPTSSTVDNSPVSAMDKAFSKALDKALTALRRPDAKLVRQHGGTTPGFYVELPHDSFRVRDEVAARLLERNDVQPFDPGLPGFGGTAILEARKLARMDAVRNSSWPSTNLRSVSAPVG